MKRKDCSPGSMTVEMAIIFPIIFFTIAGLIYIGIVQFQNITTQTAAMQAASRASYCWDFLGKKDAWKVKEDGSIYVAAPDYSDHDPYGALIDGARSTRKENAKKYFDHLLASNKMEVDWATTDDTSVEYKNRLLWSTITVKTKKQYVNPMGSLLEQVGIASKQTNEIEATAMVNDPAEFVRLAGLVYDTIKGR